MAGQLLTLLSMVSFIQKISFIQEMSFFHEMNHSSLEWLLSSPEVRFRSAKGSVRPQRLAAAAAAC